MVHSTIFSVDAEAVPKRILELMNVEKLTRENVASHLQASHLIYFLVVISRSVPCAFHTCRPLSVLQPAARHSEIVVHRKSYNEEIIFYVCVSRHCISCNLY